MANSVIGVSLKFNADISQAKQQMQSLQNSLSQIMSLNLQSNNIGGALTADLNKASTAASQLKIALSAAFNEKTGKLDLKSFQQSLQMAGTSVTTLRTQLNAIGPQGQQAFNQVALSVAAASNSMVRLNTLGQKFLTTLGNTVRYQISSSLYSAAVSSIQDALRYAEDLNESLTNIRIVTGYSAEEMDKFAEKANKAAKALSTTTTAFTDASLIYFQQGLSMDEAQKRAEVTVKMANVTGQAVSTISDQLTAVWNNFDNGTKSLEYYADVLNKLGATTASSADEISEGLNKFAAVAETVGLSYEYAAAALATVTATTRQSADVVGTAFKTLFARIQDLDLGKTLDDGTTLGSYSEALMAVGINIKDNVGNLKDMNTILDEMGAKWQTISQDQQVALAKSVAGIRQYTQLIALMENWDYMQENVSTALGASGELEKQHEIYAESWEAARDRVTAALEEIYNKLLKDDAFIKLLDFGADFVDTIDTIVDTLGGLKGVILLIGTVIMRVFNTQITSAINSAGASLLDFKVHAINAGKTVASVFTRKNYERSLTSQEQFQNDFMTNATASYGTGISGQVQSSAFKEMYDSQTKLVAQAKTLNGIEKEILESLNAQNRERFQAVEEAGAEAQQAQNEANAILYRTKHNSGVDTDQAQQLDLLATQTRRSGAGQALLADTVQNDYLQSQLNHSKGTEELITLLNNLGMTAEQVDKSVEDIYGADTVQKVRDYRQALEELYAVQKQMEQTGDPLDQEILTGRPQALISAEQELKEANARFKKANDEFEAVDPSQEKYAAAQQEQENAQLAQIAAQKKFEDLGGSDAFEKLTTNTQLYAKAQEAVTKGTNTLAGAQKNVQKTSRAVVQTVNDYTSAMGDTTQQLNANGIQTQEVVNANIRAGESYHNLKMRDGELRNGLKNTEATLASFATKVASFATRLTTLTSAVMNVGMAMSTLKGAWDTLQNPDASAWDKLVTIITALGMTLNMVTSAMSAQNVATVLGIKLKQGETLATALATKFKLGETAAVWASIAAYSIYLALIAAIIAIIALLVLAFKKQETAEEKARKALEASNKTLEKATEAYNEATKAVNEFKEAMDAIETKETELAKMTANTEEYKEAIKKLNAEYLKLIDTYNLWNKYSYNEEGIIQLDEGVEDEIEAQLSQRELDTLMHKTVANLNVSSQAYNLAKAQSTEAIEGWGKPGKRYNLVDVDLFEPIVKGLNPQLNAFQHAWNWLWDDDSKVEEVIADMPNKLDAFFTDFYSGKLKREFTGTQEEWDSIANAIEHFDTASIEQRQKLFDLYGDQIIQFGKNFEFTEKDFAKGTYGEDLAIEFSKLQQAYQANFGALQENTKALITATSDNVFNSIYKSKATNNGVINETNYQRYKAWGSSLLTQSPEVVTVTNQILNAMNSSTWRDISDGKKTTKILEENFKTAQTVAHIKDEKGTEITSASNYLNHKLGGVANVNFADGIDDSVEAAYIYAAIQGWTGVTVFDEDGKLVIRHDENPSEGEVIEDNTVLWKYINDYIAGNLNADYIQTAQAENVSNAINTGIAQSSKASNAYGVDWGNIIISAAAGGGKFNKGDILKALDETEWNKIYAGLTSNDPKNILSNLFGEGIDDQKVLNAYGYENMDELRNALLEAMGSAWSHTSFSSYANQQGVKQALEIGFKEEEFIAYRDTLAEVNTELERNPELLNEIAVANMKLNRGIKNLSSNYEDWNQALQSGSTGSVEYIEALNGMRDAVGDILDVDAKQFDPSFFIKNSNLIQQAAEGNATAIEELRQEAAQEILFDNSKLLTQSTEIKNVIDAFQAEDIEIGATIDTSEAMTALGQLLLSSGATIEDIQNAFNALGWTPQVEYMNVDQLGKIDANGYTEYNGERVYVGTGLDIKGKTQIPYIKAPGTTTPKLNAVYRGHAKTATSYKPSSGGSKKEKKNQEDEIDRYHEIKEVISDLSREYDQLGEMADRAFGQHRLDYLDAQIKKQKELTEAQHQYVQELKNNLAIDKEKLAQYGASFDEYGRIINYDEMMQVNIDAYNKRLTDGAEAAYEQFKSDIAKYEETLNELEDASLDYQNKLNEQLDLALGKVEYTVELNLSLNEDDLAWIEYQLENLEDTAFDIAKRIGLLSQSMNNTLEDMMTYKDAIRNTLLAGDQFTESELDALLDPNATKEQLASLLDDKTLTVAQVEALREYRDGIIDKMQALKDERKEVEDGLITAYENLNDEMSKGSEIIEHQKEVVENYKSIIELIGAENLGVSDELLAQMEQTNVELAKGSLSMSKTILDTRLQELEKAKQALAATDTSDEESIKYWQNTIETIEESVREAQSKLNSDWQSALESAADAFQSAVERVTKTFEKAMSGIYGNFDAMSEAFDRSKEIGELYLEDYAKIYELSKLNRDIIKSIDENDSVIAKSKLRDLQKEINDLQASNTEMTQYEVDELRARYELRLAEIALEEAQRAKTQVRMQRDSEGNWGYVYTADQASVSSAEQNYEDKLYNYQNKTQEYIQRTQEQIMQIPQSMSQAIAEIMEDVTLTEAERQLRIDDTIAHYETLYRHWTEQLGLSIEDANNLYDIDWNNYSQLTGYKISADENWIDSWSETTYAQLSGFNSIQMAQDRFVSATSVAVKDLEAEWKHWQIEVKAIFELAGDSVDNFADNMTVSLEEAKSITDETTESLKEMGEEGAEAFKDLATKAQEYFSNYKLAMDNYAKENENLITSIGGIIGVYASLKETIDQATQAQQELNTAIAAQPLPSGGGGVNEFTGFDTEATYTVYKDAWFTNKNAVQVKASDSLLKNIQYVMSAGKDPNTGENLYAFYSGGKMFGVQENVRKDLNLKAIDMSINLYSTDGINKSQGVISVVQAMSQGYITKSGNNYKLNLANGQSYYIGSSDALALINWGVTKSFDTGGYTGTWDSSGRLAMLHQKEIVLNAHDTENFLAGIEILRDITKVIDLQATAQSRAWGAISAASVNTHNQTIDQNIIVHAEFPHATDRDEIKEAILGLSNYASQFANRKI